MADSDLGDLEKDVTNAKALNQMMIQANPQVIHPSQQPDALPEYTAAQLQLQNQLEQARNWGALMEHFGMGSLALVVTDHDVPFNTTLVEGISVYDFQHLLRLLELERGTALRSMAGSLAQQVFALLQQKPSCSTSYQFEMLDLQALTHISLDSEAIVTACRPV
ncbi:hypothetical protein MMC22_008521 [Lobaria immixta]|nr:hypothetical protein [Lobaria immixta]